MSLQDRDEIIVRLRVENERLKAEVEQRITQAEIDQHILLRLMREIELKERSRLAFSLELENRTAAVERLRDAHAAVVEAGDRLCAMVTDGTAQKAWAAAKGEK